MAGEIQFASSSGVTYYFVVLNTSGLAYNGTGFEAILGANWTTYAIPMAPQDTTGIYLGDFPALPLGTYSIMIFKRVGGSAAIADFPPVAEGNLRWTGVTVEPIQTGDAYGKLPASPAAVGSAMTLTSAYDPAKTAAQAGQIPANFSTISIVAGAFGSGAFANMPAVQGITPYDTARLRGEVTVGSDGSETYYDVTDGTIKRVKLIPKVAPGGRTVVLDPT